MAGSGRRADRRCARTLGFIQLMTDRYTPFFPDSAGKKWFACLRTASSGIYRFMSTSDDFSTYVADLLSGTYDCVDRICVRDYFPLGQTSGGLLTWWNQLFPNTQLTEERLRTLAGEFARRVHAYARKHKIPLRYFAIGDKTKHAQAEKLRPRRSQVPRGVCHFRCQSSGPGLASQK